MAGTTDEVRRRVAQVVWVVCAVAALFLAAGALCIALKANPDNALVKFVIDTADKLDLGVFSRDNGVAHFAGKTHAAATKNALVNWGLAAVVWLVGGPDPRTHHPAVTNPAPILRFDTNPATTDLGRW